MRCRTTRVRVKAVPWLIFRRWEQLIVYCQTMAQSRAMAAIRGSRCAQPQIKKVTYKIEKTRARTSHKTQWSRSKTRWITICIIRKLRRISIFKIRIRGRQVIRTIQNNQIIQKYLDLDLFRYKVTKMERKYWRTKHRRRRRCNWSNHRRMIWVPFHLILLIMIMAWPTILDLVKGRGLICTIYPISQNSLHIKLKFKWALSNIQLALQAFKIIERLQSSSPPATWAFRTKQVLVKSPTSRMLQKLGIIWLDKIIQCKQLWLERKKGWNHHDLGSNNTLMEAVDLIELRRIRIHRNQEYLHLLIKIRTTCFKRMIQSLKSNTSYEWRKSYLCQIHCKCWRNSETNICITQ